MSFITSRTGRLGLRAWWRSERGPQGTGWVGTAAARGILAEPAAAVLPWAAVDKQEKIKQRNNFHHFVLEIS